MQPGGARQSIPEQKTSPLASLRPFASEVTVAGHTVVVPAFCAAEWLETLMGEAELFAVFPGLCDDSDRELVEDLLINGETDVYEVDELTLDLITSVSGKPWWIAIRMIKVAELHWGVIGPALTLQGVDATRLSLAAWLDVLWVTIFNHLDESKWIMFSTQLEMPPEGETSDAFETMEMPSDSFTSLMQG